jgi:hypothetical protein
VEIDALFQQVRDEQGQFDILVNNVFAFPTGGMSNKKTELESNNRVPFPSAVGA